MSSSSISLEPVRKEHPAESESIRRLEDLLHNAFGQQQTYRWTLDRLSDLVHPKSKAELGIILGSLIQQGLLEYEIQVESPEGGVIRRFKELSQVPRELFDPRTGTHIEVQPQFLRFVYAVPKQR